MTTTPSAEQPGYLLIPGIFFPPRKTRAGEGAGPQGTRGLQQYVPSLLSPLPRFLIIAGLG